MMLINQRRDGSVEVALDGGLRVFTAEEWRALLNSCVDELREKYGPLAEALRPAVPQEGK